MSQLSRAWETRADVLNGVSSQIRFVAKALVPKGKDGKDATAYEGLCLTWLALQTRSTLRRSLRFRGFVRSGVTGSF